MERPHDVSGGAHPGVSRGTGGTTETAGAMLVIRGTINPHPSCLT